jgi:AbrB family looped-hinge helix DNA binding protein
MDDAIATTIDSAGRIVIPKAIRERAGLYAGARVEVSVDDEGIRIAAQVSPPLLERRGRLLVVVGPVGASIDDTTVEAVREEIAQERARGTVESGAD